MAEQVGLTLAMTRAHRRDVLQRAPRSLTRTFTLREADLLRVLGEDIAFPGGDLADRARALVQGMAAARSRTHSSEDDDVRDPIGQPLEVHQKVGEAIAEALEPVLARIAALAAPGQRDSADA